MGFAQRRIERPAEAQAGRQLVADPPFEARLLGSVSPRARRAAR